MLDKWQASLWGICKRQEEQHPAGVSYTALHAHLNVCLFRAQSGGIQHVIIQDGYDQVASTVVPNPSLPTSTCALANVPLPPFQHDSKQLTANNAIIESASSQTQPFSLCRWFDSSQSLVQSCELTS